MVDLHAHSTASDGSLTPTQLVTMAKREGLSAVALTDHDTLAGLDEASEAAKSAGIRLIPGIELEVDWSPGALHLLGLGLTRWDLAIQNRLASAGDFRRKRNHAMVEALQSSGIDVSYAELVETAGHHTVGRPHFARLMVSKGIVSSYQEAFDTLIGDGKAFHVKKGGLSLPESCELIHLAGGLAVIAHPQSMQLGWDELATRLRQWKTRGLDGIEAYHPNVTVSAAHRYAALAEDLGLVATAGSDFHTPRSAVRLGRTCGRTPIDDGFATPFLER